MGNQQSGNNISEYKETNFTDQQIKDNINKLFSGKTGSPASELTFQVPDRLETDTVGSRMHGGAEHRVSNRNRYDRYGADVVRALAQTGGDVSSDHYKEFSEFSEFERIRDYMMNKNQLSALSDTPATINNNNKSFANIMKGGMVNDNSSESSSNDSSDSHSNSSTSDSPEVERKSREQERMSPLMNFNDSSENLFSVTSHNENMIPFYSSDSMTEFSFQHPFHRNRFN